MLKDVIASGNIFFDETPIDLLVPGKGKAHTAYLWTIVGGLDSNPPIRVYNFSTNRKHENAFKILSDYKGVLHSDKYGAYEALAAKKKLIWCPCMGHARRKFVEVETGDLIFRDLVLEKINKLFELEREAWEKSPDERLDIRQNLEIPILNDLSLKIHDQLIHGKYLPKSKYREALCYYYSLNPYWKNFTEHPFARLDNNVAERAIRPLAIGRKNWLFFGSVAGGQAAAVHLSLVQTCRALGINPQIYLEDVMREIMGYNMKNIRELLPYEWIKARA
jgi:hypothetical protein